MKTIAELEKAFYNAEARYTSIARNPKATAAQYLRAQEKRDAALAALKAARAAQEAK